MPNKIHNLAKANQATNRTSRLAAFFVILGSLALSSCATSNSNSHYTSGSNNQNFAVAEKVKFTDIEAAAELDGISAEDVINRSKSHVKRPGEVYLMRGLANVFSRGIDDMAAEMRDTGVDASNFSYTQWPRIADDIVNRASRKKISYPIIIIGHSLGGNESSKFANYLGQRGIKVAHVIAFDPVETGFVGKNIRRVTNYYLPKVSDNRIIAGPGFKGKIKNIDVSGRSDVSHTNVEKNAAFQKSTLRRVMTLTKKKRKREAEV